MRTQPPADFKAYIFKFDQIFGAPRFKNWARQNNFEGTDFTCPPSDVDREKGSKTKPGGRCGYKVQSIKGN